MLRCTAWLLQTQEMQRTFMQLMMHSFKHCGIALAGTQLWSSWHCRLGWPAGTQTFHDGLDYL
jgi:hypothetical protein